MKNKLSLSVMTMIGVLLVLSLLIASCTQQMTGVTTTTSKQTVSTTTSAVTTTASTAAKANWWDTFGTPQYGGTLIQAQSGLFIPNVDPYASFGGGFFQWDLSTLWHNDWTTPRDAFAFNTIFTSPDYIQGNIADKWTMTDPLTLTVTIQEGIHWENKSPVNGREFVADDVASHYDRMLGTGHGFSVPSVINAGALSEIKSVTATDKYTVQFNFKDSAAIGMMQLVDMSAQNYIEAPEWVALGGPPPTAAAAPAGGPPAGGPPDGAPPAGGPPGGEATLPSGPLTDWHTMVGTGPFLLNDFVSGATITYTKNPDYFGIDERYPKNKLPYADTLTLSLISDPSTILAALRTGKVDMAGTIGWQQAQSLAKTNPELVQDTSPAGGQGIIVRMDAKPFTDLNVRKAMQMAIDMHLIAKSHYGGIVDGNPSGMLNPIFNSGGWGFAYKDWPQSLKDEYSYNPTEAKKLLADAGYPTGFKTNVVVPGIADMELAQIMKAELADIGVDMTINAMDITAWQPIAFTRKFDQMSWDPAGKSASVMSPLTAINFFQTTYMLNLGGVNDSQYNDLVAQFNKAATLDQAKQIFKDADKYALEQHFALNTCASAFFSVWQPYLKGFSGEYSGDTTVLGKLWIDQQQKQSLSR